MAKTEHKLTRRQESAIRARERELTSRLEDVGCCLTMAIICAAIVIGVYFGTVAADETYNLQFTESSCTVISQDSVAVGQEFDISCDCNTDPTFFRADLVDCRDYEAALVAGECSNGLQCCDWNDEKSGKSKRTVYKDPYCSRWVMQQICTVGSTDYMESTSVCEVPDVGSITKVIEYESTEEPDLDGWTEGSEHKVWYDTDNKIHHSNPYKKNQHAINTVWTFVGFTALFALLFLKELVCYYKVKWDNANKNPTIELVDVEDR